MIHYQMLIYNFFIIPYFFFNKFCKKMHFLDQEIEWCSNSKELKGCNWYVILRLLTYSYDFRTVFYFRNRGLLACVPNFSFEKEKYFRIRTTTKLGGELLTIHSYGTISNSDINANNFYVHNLVTKGEINLKSYNISKNISVYMRAIVKGALTLASIVTSLPVLWFIKMRMIMYVST